MAIFGDLRSFDTGLFDEFRRMEEDMDRLFGRWPWPDTIRSASRGTYPPINVGATTDAVDIYLFAAGLDPKSVDITVQQNLLSIAGERKESRKEDADYYRQERFGGDFRRVLTLPEDVDPDKVDAHYRDGVLHIHLQRREAAKPRQITVQ